MDNPNQPIGPSTVDEQHDHHVPYVDDYASLPEFGVPGLARSLREHYKPLIGDWENTLTLILSEADNNQKAALFSAMAISLKLALGTFSQKVHDGVFRAFLDHDTLKQPEITPDDIPEIEYGPDGEIVRKKAEFWYSPNSEKAKARRAQHQAEIAERDAEVAKQQAKAAKVVALLEGKKKDLETKNKEIADLKNQVQSTPKKKNNTPKKKSKTPNKSKENQSGADNATTGSSEHEGKELALVDYNYHLTSTTTPEDMEVITNNIVDALTNTMVDSGSKGQAYMPEETARKLVAFFCKDLTGMEGLRNASALIREYTAPSIDMYDAGESQRLQNYAYQPGMPEQCRMVVQSIAHVVEDTAEPGKYLKSFRRQLKLVNMHAQYESLLEMVDPNINIDKHTGVNNKIHTATQDWLIDQVGPLSRGRAWDTLVTDWMDSAVQSGKTTYRSDVVTAKLLRAAHKIYHEGVFCLAPPNLHSRLRTLGGLSAFTAAIPIIDEHHPTLKNLCETFTKHVAWPIMEGSGIGLKPIDLSQSAKAILTRVQQALPPPSPTATGFIEAEISDMDIEE